MTERRRPTGAMEVLKQTGSHAAVDRLFVYGTLRQGQTARSLISGQIARSMPASTPGAIYVFPMGFPGFCEAAAGDDGVVNGEVLWLTELAATFGLLDAYEGDEFARVLRQVTLQTGASTWAWIYELADPAMARHGERIPHGDWARFR
jgi:gamma-glutamylcyclotransferase (GGCT)/AIG2-like uncharacterized protein YtfP